MATTINEEDNDKFQRELSKSSYGKYIEWGAGPKAARNQIERDIKEKYHSGKLKKRNLNPNKDNFEYGTFKK